MAPRGEEDPRLAFRPLRMFLDLAALALCAALFQLRLGSGAVVFLDWTPLLAWVVPVWIALVAAERWILRAYRAERLGSYPSILSVLVVGFGVAFTLVGLVNGALPSAARDVRPEVREVYGLVWRTVTPVGDPVPSSTPAQPTGDGEARVVSWRTPGEELILPLDEQAFRGVQPGAPLEVHEQAGFLGVPYVSRVRFVAR